MCGWGVGLGPGAAARTIMLFGRCHAGRTRNTLYYVPDPDERVIISMRLRRSGLDVLDREAAAEGVSRTEMIRALLAEALAARRKRGKPAPKRAQNAKNRL